MDKFGRSFETMTDNYDATTGVIKREKSKLKVNCFHVNDVICFHLNMPHNYVLVYMPRLLW